MNFKVTKILLCVFLVAVMALFAITLKKYPGEDYSYILFTILLNILLLIGFRTKKIFFDTFIGLFFWLGFWFKFSLRLAFMDGTYKESVGHFDFSPLAYDFALNITSCGILALILASYIRERFFYYSISENKNTYKNLYNLYQKYRNIFLIIFSLLILFTAITNAYLGIYQRGSVPRFHLPKGLGGVYTWLLLFGLASISTLLLDFEFRLKKNLFIVVTVALLENFFSSVSILSRGMILNSSALLFGINEKIKNLKLTKMLRFKTFTVFLLGILFVTSIYSVTLVRNSKFFGQSVSTSMDSMLSNTKAIFVDRFVGIEGIMAVTSYPDIGWELWRSAWNETYQSTGTSMFDLKIIDSPYKNLDLTQHHFISLPGILAFSYYPGSSVFLFFSMLFLGLLAAGIECSVYKLSYNNIIFAALIGQVIANRYANFGYVPQQSYLLFVSIYLNVFLLYAFDKIVKRLASEK